MPEPFAGNWDDAQWAQEIRKDELRIHRYFKMLPAYLDLPGEDDLIFKRLMAQPELVPAGGAKPFNPRERWHESDDADDEDGDAPSGRRTGGAAQLRLEKLAREWNLLAARLGNAELRAALTVTCGFGKLIARLASFTEALDNGESTALKRALARRMLADFNELSGELRQFAATHRCWQTQIDAILEPLAMLRDGAAGQSFHLESL